MLHMPGYIDTCNLVFIAFRKIDNVIFRLEFKNGQCRVDIHLVSCGNLIEHHLKRVQIGKRFPTSKHIITIGRNLIHHFNAMTYLFCRKTFWMGIFFFIDAEGTMIAAVVRNKNSNSRSAFTRFVWMSCLNCACSSIHLRLYHVLIRLKFILPSRERQINGHSNLHCSVISNKHGHLLLS